MTGGGGGIPMAMEGLGHGYPRSQQASPNLGYSGIGGSGLGNVFMPTGAGGGLSFG